jgi:hypothetical protein
MTRSLHPIGGITDPEEAAPFDQTLELELQCESPILRDGEPDATLYSFGLPARTSGPGSQHANQVELALEPFAFA